MRALTVTPLQPGSAEVIDFADPQPGDGELLVEGIALGVCGTDREIIAGDYGWGPAGPGRRAGAASRRETWWWASSAGPIRCPVRPARTGSSTSAATAGTPSGGSRSA